MQLLVKVSPPDAFQYRVAHIPDLLGRPLCGARLNSTAWSIQDYTSTKAPLVCRTCRVRNGTAPVRATSL
jgi:hypothetical protein